MNITQDVITDLLPAYVSGEASADTKTLVDEFLREHPQFAAIVHAARRGASEPLLADHRAIAPDLEREVVRRTRAVISRQRLMLAFAIVLTPLGMLWRLIGRDPLSINRKHWPGWSPYPARYRDKDHFTRMY